MMLQVKTNTNPKPNFVFSTGYNVSELCRHARVRLALLLLLNKPSSSSFVHCVSSE